MAAVPPPPLTLPSPPPLESLPSKGRPVPPPSRGRTQTIAPSECPTLTPRPCAGAQCWSAPWLPRQCCKRGGQGVRVCLGVGVSARRRRLGGQGRGRARGARGAHAPQDVGAASLALAALAALPDARGLPLHALLAAEDAQVLCAREGGGEQGGKGGGGREGSVSARARGGASLRSCALQRAGPAPRAAAPSLRTCVLADLDLLDQLTQGSTVARAVLPGDADLLGALAHGSGALLGGCGGEGGGWGESGGRAGLPGAGARRSTHERGLRRDTKKSKPFFLPATLHLHLAAFQHLPAQAPT